MTDNPLSPFHGGVLALEEIEAAVEFFDLEAVSAALKANQFDVASEIERIISHIKNPDPEISIKALQHWHKLKMDLAKANGIIISGSQVRRIQEKDGSVREETFTATSLMRRLKKGNERNDDHNPHQTIDAVTIGSGYGQLDKADPDSPGGSEPPLPDGESPGPPGPAAP